VDATWTASLEPLKTRSEVRGLLAKGLNDLKGAHTTQDFPAELSDLATGSDREVIDSCRRLDILCAAFIAADARYLGTATTKRARDLFKQALQRMKQLPPDPREALHTAPQASVGAAESGKAKTIRRKP
jgi:hypothetical protein